MENTGMYHIYIGDKNQNKFLGFHNGKPKPHYGVRKKTSLNVGVKFYAENILINIVLDVKEGYKGAPVFLSVKTDKDFCSFKEFKTKYIVTKKGKKVVFINPINPIYSDKILLDTGIKQINGINGNFNEYGVKLKGVGVSYTDIYTCYENTETGEVTPTPEQRVRQIDANRSLDFNLM